MKIASVLYFPQTIDFLHAQSSLNSVEALTLSGNTVTCILPSESSKKTITQGKFSKSYVQLNSGVPIISPIIFNLKVFRNMIKSYATYDIVIFKADTIFSVLPALFFQRFRRLPKTVLLATSVPVEVKGIRGALHILLYDLSMRMTKSVFSGIVVISPMMASDIVKKYQIPEQKVGIWSVTISSDVFDPSQFLSSRKQIRLKLGLSDEQFLFTYCGTLSPTRGLFETVTAFSRVVDCRKNIRLLFLGGGEIKERLTEIIEEQRLNDKVFIEGPVPFSAVPSYLAASDAGICPLPSNSYWDNQPPIKILEYLSMHKPVVVSQTPAHVWMLGVTKFTFYFKTMKPDDIADAMIRLYDACHQSGIDFSETARVTGRFSLGEHSRIQTQFFARLLKNST